MAAQAPTRKSLQIVASVFFVEFLVRLIAGVSRRKDEAFEICAHGVCDVPPAAASERPEGTRRVQHRPSHINVAFGQGAQLHVAARYPRHRG
jgi:hypothetical protein